MNKKNFYILLPLERALRLWRTSGKRCTFGTYCQVLGALGYRLLMTLLLLGCSSGLAHAFTVDTAIIAQMESSGNPLAVNGSHRGLCQLSEGVLKDYNKAHKTAYKPQELFNGVINLKIAEWYLNTEIVRLLHHYRLADTPENRLTAWRLGVKSVLSNKQAKKYVKRYNELKKKLNSWIPAHQYSQ